MILIPPAKSRGYEIRVPKWLMKSFKINKDVIPHPPVVLKLFDAVITPEQQSSLFEAATAILRHPYLTFFHKMESRSTTPALHLGIWEPSSLLPLVSQDSHQRKCSNRKMRAQLVRRIDRFLLLVKDTIVRELSSRLLRMDPEVYERGLRCILPYACLSGPHLRLIQS
jgi:hypothetical protein